MAVPNTPNADLEQSLFKANLKETRLRHRTMLAALVPAVAGAVWLLYTVVEITFWQAKVSEVQEREAGLQQREVESKKLVADAEARRAAAEGTVQGARDREKAAKEHAADIEQRLVKVRDELGGFGTLLNDISAVKLKAAKLNASEAVESQLSEIRGKLGRTLGRIEQEVDKGLPEGEQKPRVFIFLIDESQRAFAKSLAPILEEAGYDIADIVKNPGRKVDATEIRYFREPQDKAEAARIQELVAKQTGQTDCKVARTSDPDNASGSRKFQVWLSKLPPVASH